MTWVFVVPLFKKFPTTVSVVLRQFFPFTLVCRMLRSKIIFNIGQSQIQLGIKFCRANF